MSTPASASDGADPRWLDGVEAWSRGHQLAADGLLAVAMAAVVGTLSVSGKQGIDWPTGWGVVLTTSFVILHGTVAIRRRAPAIAYALASAAMLAVAIAPTGRVADAASNSPEHVAALFLPSSLLFLLMLGTAAAHLPTGRSRVALVIALIGAAVAVGRAAETIAPLASREWLLRAYVWGGLTLIAAATWSLGRFTLVRRQRRAAEGAESARLAVLTERARIAREMHDIVAHSLAVIVRQADGGAYVAERRPDQAAQALQTVADTGRAALREMRGLLSVLRDPGSAAAGGPQPTLADLPQLVAGVRDTGLRAELAETGTPFRVGPATELAAYRLAQEGLTNVVKHAGGGASAVIALRWSPEELLVEVTDDGGADVDGRARPLPGAGAGLIGLGERVAAVGGVLRAEPREPGFALQARFPRLQAR